MVQLVVSFPGPFRARQQRNIFYGTTYLATPKSPDFPPILHAKSGENRQNPPNLGEDGLGNDKAGFRSETVHPFWTVPRGYRQPVQNACCFIGLNSLVHGSNLRARLDQPLDCLRARRRGAQRRDGPAATAEADDQTSWHKQQSY